MSGLLRRLNVPGKPHLSRIDGQWLCVYGSYTGAGATRKAAFYELLRTVHRAQTTQVRPKPHRVESKAPRADLVGYKVTRVSGAWLQLCEGGVVKVQFRAEVAPTCTESQTAAE